MYYCLVKESFQSQGFLECVLVLISKDEFLIYHKVPVNIICHLISLNMSIKILKFMLVWVIRSDLATWATWRIYPSPTWAIISSDNGCVLIRSIAVCCIIVNLTLTYKLQANCINSRKYIWKCRLENVSRFVSASKCYIHSSSIIHQWVHHCYISCVIKTANNRIESRPNFQV